MSGMSPALAAVSFDQNTALATDGRRLAFELTGGGVYVCGSCALRSPPWCDYGRSATYCSQRYRKDGRNGIWRPAP